MKKKSSKINRIREYAFYILFSMRVGKLDVDEAMETFLKAEEVEGLKAEIIRKVNTWKRNREDIDKKIGEHLKKGSIENLNNIAISVLRLGICEMEYLPEVPERVAINEAVNLAKEFGDEPTAKLVNGIMDARLRAISSGDAVEDVETKVEMETEVEAETEAEAEAEAEAKAE